MHHPRSISDARRLRLASLLLLVNRLLILAGGGMLMVSLFATDRHLTMLGSGLLIASILLFVAQWFAASEAACPLCGTPVLAPMGCMKHRKARRLLGSYKLRVAIGVIFTESFRCPYCNEPTAMDVREKLRGPRRVASHAHD